MMKRESAASAVLLMCLLLGFGAPVFGQSNGHVAAAGPNVHARGSLANSRTQFEKFQQGHVAFIGGSITEMNGYRPMVCNFLSARFPNTNFTFTDAGIASTCSTTGAFRLAEDVLSKGPVDLLFVEFAVNDDQDAMHERAQCIRGLEGIVRGVRKHNPHADIVVTFFVNEGMIAKLQADREPISTEAHQAVAVHYQIPTIHLAREVAQQMQAGTLTWEKYGGVHPAPFGNRIAADMIGQLLNAAWQEPLDEDAVKQPHPIPPQPLDPHHYGNGRFISPQAADVSDGWQWRQPDWKSLAGQSRARFADRPLLSADGPGAELTLRFTGRAIGAYLLAGPDAGVLEASVDGEPFRDIDLYHRYSAGLHYPRTVMFAAELPNGPHTLRLRVSDRRHAASKGTAVRILEFTAN